MKEYYLAYGSNLNLEEMKFRCPTAKAIGTVMLDNYKLVYKGKTDDFSYLTIEECEGTYGPLGLYEISHSDIFSLDRYEGYPSLYSKRYVSVKISDKEEQALIYVMKPLFDYHLPSDEYVEICSKGYKDFGFDQEVLKLALTDTIKNMPKQLKKYR